MTWENSKWLDSAGIQFQVCCLLKPTRSWRLRAKNSRAIQGLMVGTCWDSQIEDICSLNWQRLTMFTSASHLDTFPLKLRGLQTRLQTRAVCIQKISQQMPDQKVMERKKERERERYIYICLICVGATLWTLWLTQANAWRHCFNYHNGICS